MSNFIMWTIDEGLEMTRDVEKVIAPKGFHCALGGGVMLRETSRKDLDIFIYPHHTNYDGDGKEEKADFAPARAALTNAFRLKNWEKLTYKYDRKDVWKCETNDGKRIDFFFLQ